MQQKRDLEEKQSRLEADVEAMRMKNGEADVELNGTCQGVLLCVNLTFPHANTLPMLYPCRIRVTATAIFSSGSSHCLPKQENGHCRNEEHDH